MIFFQAKNIVSLTADNSAASFPLAMHGVCCNNFALNIQISEHFLENRDLIRLFVDLLLCQCYAAACYIRTQNLQRAVRLPGLGCAANRFPVHCNHFSRGSKPSAKKLQNNTAKFLSVHHAQYPSKCRF